jgi:hypothetical protein
MSGAVGMWRGQGGNCTQGFGWEKYDKGVKSVIWPKTGSSCERGNGPSGSTKSGKFP